jgi:hypothetical protein
MATIDPDVVLEPDNIGQTTITKVAVSTALSVRTANLDPGRRSEISPINARLAFVAGINCDTPYGCIAIDYDSLPNLELVRSTDPFSVNPIQCLSDVTGPSNLEVQFYINYRSVNGKLNLTPTTIRFNAMRLVEPNTNIAITSSVNQSRIADATKRLEIVKGVAGKLSMSCCGLKGFDIVTSEYQSSLPQTASFGSFGNVKF